MPHGITVRADGFAEAVYAMEPAWHGLGKVYDHPMTSAEILASEALNWRVVQMPAALGKRNDDGSIEWVPQPEHMFNVREDNGQVLGLVTDHYKVVQNVEGFEFMDALVENHEMLYEAAFSLYEGRRVVILGRMPGYREVVPGDVLLPYVHLSLSHDGKGSITFGPVHTRMVCANTYAKGLAEGNSRELSVRHSGNIKEKLNKARDILGVISASFAQYAEISQELAKRRLAKEEWRDFLNMMCPELDPRDPDYTERRAEKIVETRLGIQQCFRNSRNTLFGIEESAWAAYNAVAEYIDHLPRRGATRRQKAEARFNVTMAGPGRDMKERAFKLAMRFCSMNTEAMAV